jgi:LPS O-antigen subunit length determinant protein (WzzB/FepE family)
MRATDHMTKNNNALFNFRQYNTKQYVRVVNNERMKIIVVGLIIFCSKIILNFFFVKNYTSNLLSI